jgi:hypothetical protein
MFMAALEAECSWAWTRTQNRLQKMPAAAVRRCSQWLQSKAAR